jgi:hypothetical protein
MSLIWKSGFLGIGGGWDDKMTALIQENGRMGWELVSVAPVIGAKNTQFILFFKRKISG